MHRENPESQILVTGCYAQRAPQEIADLPGVTSETHSITHHGGRQEALDQLFIIESEQIKALAKQGAAVLWMQAPADRDWRLRPSFYTVPEGAGRIVMVQSALVPHLPDNPQSQLNLIQLVRLALHPEPERLPTTQPYSGVYGIQDPAR